MTAEAVTKFGEICAHSAFGPRFSSDDYAIDGNVATLRTTDISADGRIEYSTMPVAQLDLSRFNQHLLQKDDLVITPTGRVGTTAVFSEYKLPVLPGAFLIRFRLNRSVADPKFYCYFFNSPEGQFLISSVATGSVQQNLNITALHSLEVPLPPLRDQKAIAAMLGALDDKIKLNQRMDVTLETMARALFQSWFVDFDPVRAKLDGRQPPGLDPAIAALFPNEFEDSELGPIPKGWLVGALDEIVTFSRNTVDPSQTPDELFAHFSLPAFDEGRTPKIERGNAIKSQKLAVPADSVLLSKLNPHIPRIWLPDLPRGNRAICSTEFLVAQPDSGFSRDFLFCLLTSGQFAAEYATLVTGTTGSHQRVKGESVLQMKIVIPPPPLIDRLSTLAKPMFDKVTQNIRECATIAAIRDTLLPKLLSGELRVDRLAA